MKQYNFICENDHDNIYLYKDNPPIACKKCSILFEEERVIEIEIIEEKEINSLTLIYQINQQRIEIPSLSKTIIGRENFGADVLSKILFNSKPVISRKHCSIEFREGDFYLIDEGSLNGTFIYKGDNKISCKDNQQKIENKNVIYLGEEPFLTLINFKEQIAENKKVNNDEIQQKMKISNYKCKKCGITSNEDITKCPNCGFKKAFVPVYE
jgi:hypothetical protein